MPMKFLPERFLHPLTAFEVVLCSHLVSSLHPEAARSFFQFRLAHRPAVN